MVGQKLDSQPLTPTNYDQLLSLPLGHPVGNAIGRGIEVDDVAKELPEHWGSNPVGATSQIASEH
jgi:hypothetical protein